MRLKRLYDDIEAGSLDTTGSSLGERIAGLAALRAQAPRADAERTETMLASSTHQRLTEATVRELVSEARTRLRLGKGGYRREYVRAFAQHVEVADDAIYIKGSKSTLLRMLVATKGGKSAGIGVLGFIPKWRRGRDSNPRYPREYAAFRVRCIRPLCHLSRPLNAFANRIGSSVETAVFHPFAAERPWTCASL